MRKIFYLLSTVLLVFSSCSEENKIETPQTTVMLKKSIFTYPDEKKSTITYSYEGNKLKQKDYGSGMIEEYLYTGDLITGTKFYENGVLKGEWDYIYEGNKLTQEIHNSDFSSPTLRKSTYTYGTDGIILVHYSDIDKSTKAEKLDSGFYDKLTYINDNFIKRNNIVGSNEEVEASQIFTYDDKKNPLDNVLGYDKLIFKNDNCQNNILTINSSHTSGQTFLENYSYKYNDKGYPTEAKKSYTAKDQTQKDSYTVQYIYE